MCSSDLLLIIFQESFSRVFQLAALVKKSSIPHFLTSLIQFVLKFFSGFFETQGRHRRLKFFYRQEAGGEYGVGVGGSCLGKAP